ncbi:S-formylglutathione hydrolase [Trichomonascus vanleenenianus]|uniref:S-formylglutathione hydrolase n=1 Tax=Trichomonascus vanleenenianus TaxID=2268995 RepID=UPI003EC9AFA4
MRVNVFFPPGASAESKVPVLFFLSGLTCTPDNCSEKGFFQAHAAKRGIAIVYPDTSPRNVNIQGEDDSYDFGSGASFYINATKEPWSKHYQMDDYIVKELPEALFGQFSELDGSRVSITGHSMGGHGALTLFLKNPGKYKSVSAFSPIANPSKCPWGVKAFTGYFGEEEKNGKWKENDATELIKSYQGPTPTILIDVGLSDNFYQDKQLLPENLVDASDNSAYKGNVDLRFHEGYDHSYFFVSSFAGDHVDHAVKHL